ncbi:MAG: recombinase family protein [Verrucomicrobiia bacterium]
MNAYSLVRFSTDRQQFGSSKARQLERSKAECARRGWAFDERLCISDLGVSAFRGKNFRPKFALGKFIEASKRGMLLPEPVLIVENPDRFSRDVLDSADSELWGLVKRGVDVLFLSNGLLLTKGDENDPAKRAILMFEFHRANGESKRKSDLISSAFAKKYQGAANGQCFQWGRWQPRWIDFVGENKQAGAFRLNAKAAIVQRVVREYLGGKSMIRIAVDLNREKVPSIRLGRRWTQGNVWHLLRSPQLIGNAEISGHSFERYYPAVISDDEWQRLQASLAVNRVRMGGSREGDWIANLFRNRTECAKCGGRVNTQMTCHGQDKYWFKCQGARYDRCSCRRMVPIAVIERDFFGGLLLETPAGLLGRHDTGAQARIGAAQARVAALGKQFEDMTELVGAVPVMELKTKLSAIQVEREAAKAELAAAVQAATSAGAAPAALSDIRQVIQCLEGRPGAAAVRAANRAAVDLHAQLGNPEVRRRLLGLLPGLVSDLVVDLERRRYQVRFVGGEVSDWRSVA